MSTEISTILASAGALAVQHGLDEDTLAVAGGANQSKRISIEGGVFRKLAGGKEVATIEDRHMNVIFVKMAHTPSRTFYAQAYKKGVKISPTCWSNDAQKPDADVKTPQAESCDKCQFSVKGSGQNGQGTACRLSWRTAVVLPHDPAGDVMQLVLPAASVWGQEDSGKWPFRPYVQMLANNNVSAGRVVTKMQFDMKSSAPRLLFSPSAAVPAEDLEVLARQAKSQAAEQAVKLTVYQTDSQGEEDDGEEFVTAKPEESTVEADEPVLRGTQEARPEPVKDASEVVRKWARKG